MPKPLLESFVGRDADLASTVLGFGALCARGATTTRRAIEADRGAEREALRLSLRTRDGAVADVDVEVERREDVLFLGPPGTGKSHLAQALGLSAIQQGHRVRYREAHVLLEELADATLERRRKEVMLDLATVPLLVIDDLGMRKLPTTAAEDLLELIMRR